ncbi:cora-like Mg2+ transporter protein-domain-containing protein [Lactarius pseudohatsudake]|nr:cora-like Mg2+ transporter protein-domain-containing protein [Lactarius pseudohatsudake]
MPREDSLSDFDGESITSDEEAGEITEAPARGRSPRPRASASSDRPHSRSDKSKSLKSPKSITSRKTDRAATAPQQPYTGGTPGDRLRATVRKVIALHRTSAIIRRGGLGAEPGVDPRRHSAFATFGNIRQKCLIDIIDYSSLRCSTGRMTNNEFVEFLKNREASAPEPWVKVRWINVGGISWDVISALALKYDMHPLSVEDLLHRRGHARSKADYYPKHLFIRVLCHTLGSSTRASGGPEGASPAAWSSPAAITGLPRSSSPQRLDDKLGIVGDGTYGDDRGSDDDPIDDQFERATLIDPELGGQRGSLLAQKRRRAAAELTLEELKKGDRVDSKPNFDLTEPIASRIRQRDTSLRTTADPSLLVESLLDLVVDAVLEVVDEYHARLSLLEQRVLIQSKVSTVRSLHILSGDLILHKRTLEPIKALVYALRRYDVDRTAACLDSTSTSGGQKVVGFMSHKAKIYLADVHDHIEYALTSLDMYAAMAENLINYTFNMASYEMNVVMRRLTLCTIVFLPLTLLTGYFGMNFENMWTIHHGHSDVVFWIIAIPVMVSRCT